MKKIVCTLVLSLVFILGCTQERERDEPIPEELIPLLGTWVVGSILHQHEIQFDSSKEVKIFDRCISKYLTNYFSTGIYGENKNENYYRKSYAILWYPGMIRYPEYKYLMTIIGGVHDNEQSVYIFNFIDDTHIEGKYFGCGGNLNWKGTFSGEKVD